MFENKTWFVGWVWSWNECLSFVLEICENRGLDEDNWQTLNYEITNGHRHNNQVYL